MNTETPDEDQGLERAGVPSIIRRARVEDAEDVAGLLTALGYPSTVGDTKRRIEEIEGAGDTAVFVAERDQRVVGVLSFHCLPMFHVAGFLGRITSLVIAPEQRGGGLGRQLVEAGEAFGRERGCVRFEVTSGDRRVEAHAFYEHLGYQVDCRRFVK